MIDDVQRVLQMVADGSVTAEEAADLLDVLESASAGATQLQPGTVAVPAPSPARVKKGRPDVELLARATMHGVNAEYVREMAEVGYANLGLEDLTRMRMHGIDGDFVRSMSEVGLSNLSTQDLVRLAVAGVDQEDVRVLRSIAGGELEGHHGVRRSTSVSEDSEDR
jgi:hypothetical protein